MKTLRSKSSYKNWKLSREKSVRFVSNSDQTATRDFFDQEIKKGDYVFGVQYDKMIFGVVDDIINEDVVMVALMKERTHFNRYRKFNGNARPFVQIPTVNEKESIWARGLVKIDPEEGFKYNLVI